MSKATAGEFMMTSEHRRFVEFCESCRTYGYIGICVGSPGVGKTSSAWKFTRWREINEVSDRRRLIRAAAGSLKHCRGILYTPPVVTTPNRIQEGIEQAVETLNSTVADATLVKRSGDLAHRWRLAQIANFLELIIIDEADRLTMPALEEVRSQHDNRECGVVLIGMPGLEKRLSRFPQFYSRIGFVHHFRPLRGEEVADIAKRKWERLAVYNTEDPPSREAMAAIIRIVGGNHRLLRRLFEQMERVMKINRMKVITPEVVQTARESLVIGET